MLSCQQVKFFNINQYCSLVSFTDLCIFTQFHMCFFLPTVYCVYWIMLGGRDWTDRLDTDTVDRYNQKTACSFERAAAWPSC